MDDRKHHLRFHEKHQESAAHPFGTGFYGRFAEKVARSLGTPQFLIGQTLALIVWILLNGVILHGHDVWDVYPFILLNLMLSFQAAYAAPLILLAQNRQENRDRVTLEQDRHRAAQTKADTEYLARELAALRLAVGEVVTREYLRHELEDLRTLLADPLPESTDQSVPGR